MRRLKKRSEAGKLNPFIDPGVLGPLRVWCAHMNATGKDRCPDCGRNPERVGVFSVWNVDRSGMARPLVTVRPDAKAWKEGDPELDKLALKDAIVRLHPPYDASAELIRELAEHCKQCGACVVRVGPKAAAPAVVRRVGKREAAKARPVEGLTVRQVVSAMVEEAHTDDREALDASVDEYLSAEGL